MFRTAWFCVNCKSELTDDQRMFSNGRCPACGFKHESACTIVETYEKAYRKVMRPWNQWLKFGFTRRVYRTSTRKRTEP